MSGYGNPKQGSPIGSSPVPVSQGGTGATDAAGARANLGVTPGLTSPVGIGDGGTGATTAPLARTALGLGTAAVKNVGTGSSQVVTMTAGIKAKGQLSVVPTITLGDTFTVDVQTFTLVAARSGMGEVTLGADAHATALNIIAAVTADMLNVTATYGGFDGLLVHYVDVEATTPGAAGNAYPFTSGQPSLITNGNGLTLGGSVFGVDPLLPGIPLPEETSHAGVSAPNQLDADETGKEIVNTGATAKVYQILPAGAVGLWFTFTITDADGMVVSPFGSETMRIAGTTCPSGGNIESTDIGASITLRHNGSDWTAVSIVGTWTVNIPS